jgi:valyl-tRNA synthetase (EC 6.1.1.9)
MPKMRGNKFEPETDVMDTWMTSSLTPLINSLWAYEDAEKQKTL